MVWLFIPALLSMGAKAGSLGWGISIRYVESHNIFIWGNGLWLTIEGDEYIEGALRIGWLKQNTIISPYLGIGFSNYIVSYYKWNREDRVEYSAGGIAGICYNPFHKKEGGNFLTIEPEMNFEIKYETEKGELKFILPAFGISLMYNFGGL